MSASKIKLAQLSLEFVVMFASGMMFLAIFLVVGNTLLSEKSSYQHYTAFRDAGYAIQSELIMASRSQLGYERNIIIPQRIDKQTFEIDNVEDEFWFVFSDQRISFRTPPLYGNLSKGQNNITKNETHVIITH